MCNLKLTENIEKTDSEIQLQADVLEGKFRLISMERYVSNHSSEYFSFSRGSIPDLYKICSECGKSATLERHPDRSLELSGEAMKPFYHMWSRSQELNHKMDKDPKVIAPPFAEDVLSESSTNVYLSEDSDINMLVALRYQGSRVLNCHKLFAIVNVPTAAQNVFLAAIIGEII
ncbi:hypothetical protein CHS0354_029798 [Potamilus streckersoni]|uniref:Uncharacterized protein n=1 Tax=Potamilus streckersoni TaxID=2493646 RepID=A0AAE0TIN6_9BIVA|nr:hypothetical protein CHS0354_029798 [Potamilus streckersoni]